MKQVLLAICIVWGLAGCGQLLAPDNTASFPGPIPSPERNPQTAEGIELGRRLFYDTRLSANGKVSCATCHQQALAFTDGKALTRAGVSGKPLMRHAPALINLAWHSGLFWDGGAKDIESLAFAPLMHPDEMAVDMRLAIEQFREDADYRRRFKTVFGTDTIVSAYVVRALAQFQRALISNNSRYDQYTRGDEGAVLTAQELQGQQLFTTLCASCHTPPFFTDHDYHNNGLDREEQFNDNTHEGINQGRYRISDDVADMGKFKTPTLRNVALTAPYMHDGRFETLWEVIHHYTEDVLPSSTLDSTLVNSAKATGTGIDVTFEEQEAIIAFLETLTDSTFITNPAFAKPGG